MVPQALALAKVASASVQIGLYTAILPAGVYVLLGTGRTLLLGLVAIVSLLTKPHVIGELRDRGFRACIAGKIFPSQLEVCESLRRA